ncbi:Dimethyladenosine transferase [Kickxella alabastrina]|uniref:Dimethyladenosine transferase n=1 Tax=Kickxella alabastrina TaxID=61397 RepID=A0ACC1IL79_9FUNG|nr:Dimethyladenosine transferase [Kickxella alabastrina]
MQMLEDNYKTFCASNELMIEPDFDIKSKVLGVLEQLSFSDTRAAKMDGVDFLRMLSAFHDANIHFC